MHPGLKDVPASFGERNLRAQSKSRDSTNDGCGVFFSLHVTLPVWGGGAPSLRWGTSLLEGIFPLNEPIRARLFLLAPRPTSRRHHINKGWAWFEAKKPTAFSSSLSAREKARLFQASRKGVCAIARASPPGLQQRRFWRFLDLHHCQCVLTWSCCSSHIDVCTLLPAPFFVASTNWEPKQTARTAQHVVKHLTLSVFL